MTLQPNGNKFWHIIIISSSISISIIIVIIIIIIIIIVPRQNIIIIIVIEFRELKVDILLFELSDGCDGTYTVFVLSA